MVVPPNHPNFNGTFYYKPSSYGVYTPIIPHDYGKARLVEAIAIGLVVALSNSARARRRARALRHVVRQVTGAWEVNYPNDPRCEPWCWNMYRHLPQKSASFVGKYTWSIGASGLSSIPI